MEEQSSQSAPSNDMDSWGGLRTRGYRHNPEQKHFLVSFMEAHREFAFGRYPGPRQKAQALWVQLTEEMNARGPKKTVAQWQKAWADVKSRARHRVFTKANNPNFDPVNDIDARVLALINSGNENSNTITTANSIDYGACDSGINETDGQTDASHFLDSLEADVLPPEMVLLPETDRPESVGSCSITDIKLVLEPEKHMEGDHVDDEGLEDQTSPYDSEDIGRNFEHLRGFSDIMDSGQGYDDNNVSNSKDSRHNQHHRSNLNLRNRWRRPSRNSSSRPNITSPSPDLHRRQTETLEAISKALLQNAENEKERNKLMSQNLEVSKARLKAEIERNNLLRDLVSTVKGLSQDKNVRLR